MEHEPQCYTKEEHVKIEIKPVENPAPNSSFGFAGKSFSVQSNIPFHEAVLSLPMESAILQENEIDPATVRIFRWDEERKAFCLEHGSILDDHWQTVSSPITGSGIYTLVGLSTNPWIQETVELFWHFAPLLEDESMRDVFVPPICKLILCASPFLQRRIQKANRSGGLGLGGFPDGDGRNVCELCLATQGRLPELELLEVVEQEIRKPFKPFGEKPWSLSRWLNSNTNVRDAIVWREPSNTAVTGVPKSYASWTQLQKDELFSYYWMIRNGNSPGLSATPPITVNANNSGELFAAELDPPLAWQYFVTHVAQSLVVQTMQWVPWSITGYTAAELEILFDSHSFFEFSYILQQYGVLMQHNILVDHGAAMPGDPQRTFQFLRNNSLIGTSRQNTIERMLDWCRTNLMHFIGGFDPANLQAHWQYNGWPPVERIFSGTTHQQYGFGHWTGGCWGTVGFLRAALRTANIPVSLVEMCGHALPKFVRDQLYLSHGDDPYNAFTKATPPIPIAQLLLDQTTFNSWYGPQVSAQTACNNIGRRTAELGVQYLPNYLLRIHCGDIQAGRVPAQSNVYHQTGLSRYYTVADLLAAGLWTRMDSKIASFGGCGQIPP